MAAHKDFPFYCFPPPMNVWQRNAPSKSVGWWPPPFPSTAPHPHPLWLPPLPFPPLANSLVPYSPSPLGLHPFPSPGFLWPGGSSSPRLPAPQLPPPDPMLYNPYTIGRLAPHIIYNFVQYETSFSSRGMCFSVHKLAIQITFQCLLLNPLSNYVQALAEDSSRTLQPCIVFETMLQPWAIEHLASSPQTTLQQCKISARQTDRT